MANIRVTAQTAEQIHFNRNPTNEPSVCPYTKASETFLYQYNPEFRIIIKKNQNPVNVYEISKLQNFH